MNEWIEWMNEGMNEWIEWINEWMNEWNEMKWNERMNEWIHLFVFCQRILLIFYGKSNLCFIICLSANSHRRIVLQIMKFWMFTWKCFFVYMLPKYEIFQYMLHNTGICSIYLAICFLVMGIFWQKSMFFFTTFCLNAFRIPFLYRFCRIRTKQCKRNPSAFSQVFPWAPAVAPLPPLVNRVWLFIDVGVETILNRGENINCEN